jgi:hypothetical protein
MPDNSLPNMMIQPKTNNHLSLIIWIGVLYCCRENITDVMSALQIHLFMQNKAKFRKVKLNVNNVITKDYAEMDTWSIRKNKANTNPIQSQIKANTNPIQTQYKAKQTQFPIILVSLYWLCIISFSVIVTLLMFMESI